MKNNVTIKQSLLLPLQSLRAITVLSGYQMIVPSICKYMQIQLNPDKHVVMLEINSSSDTALHTNQTQGFIVAISECQ
ncbi:hypothetical protein RO3G_09218 [Rhizopus delemar RA 99-880]|uniref:Uncharacterized protein n=1 Tax=Rhizopus delemar (strain RA 99-880 / ATCC MYA-4621 / FGSC 9543 / NRRL 43880) TaxID=246409 RepID=I1C7S8_RHIO9|nr:hypothetical protein RO3G_09218 [Rhizopus delemar RA 99-880]|eukprot:EIE84508.1 hypothetical protein RO3G_09218 [Rhizopus delemar RA 99-880]